MSARNQEAEEEGLIKSTLDQTNHAIDQRIKLLQANHLSLQSELTKMEVTPKSISDIIGDLGLYSFAQSPVQPMLRDLYTSQYHSIQQYRCVLPPPSEGQGSINDEEDRPYEPSFDWLSRSIIDSTLLSLDQVEAKKSERRKVPTNWGGVCQLLVANISRKIYFKAEVQAVQKYVQDNFSKFPWVKVKRIKPVFYKAKPSLLLKFADEYSCFFSYVNFVNPERRKEALGSRFEVYRVVANRINNKQEQKWVAVLFRKLPLAETKESFLDLLSRNKLFPVWMEDLITIEAFKYTLCKVSYLDDAFQFCSRFQINPPIRDVKVNLHPKSCKAWKRDNEEYNL